MPGASASASHSNLIGLPFPSFVVKTISCCSNQSTCAVGITVLPVPTFAPAATGVKISFALKQYTPFA